MNANVAAVVSEMFASAKYTHRHTQCTQFENVTRELLAVLDVVSHIATHQRDQTEKNLVEEFANIGSLKNLRACFFDMKNNVNIQLMSSKEATSRNQQRSTKRDIHTHTLSAVKLPTCALAVSSC